MTHFLDWTVDTGMNILNAPIPGAVAILVVICVLAVIINDITANRV